MSAGHDLDRCDKNSRKQISNLDSVEYQQNKLFHCKFENNGAEKNKQEVCDQCLITFESFFSRVNHVCLPYLCKKCSKAFKHDSMLRTHQCNAGESGEEECNDKAAFLCQHCGSTFQKCELLFYHYRKCPKKKMKECIRCKVQLPSTEKYDLCHQCKKKESRRALNNSPSKLCSESYNKMEVSETDSVASPSESPTSSDTSCCQKFLFPRLSHKRRASFKNVLEKCAKRTSGSFEVEKTKQDNFYDSTLKSKQQLKKSITKVGAKVILRKINISSFENNSKTENSVIPSKQNSLLLCNDSFETNYSKALNTRSLPKVVQVSTETKKSNMKLPGTDIKNGRKEISIKQKEFQNTTLSDNLSKRCRKMISSSTKKSPRSPVSCRRNSFERTSFEKSDSTVQTEPVTSDNIHVRSENINSCIATDFTEKQKEKSPLVKFSGSGFSRSIVNSSPPVQPPGVSRKTNDVAHETNRSPRKKNDGSERSVCNDSTSLEVMFNALPDEESGILLRVPAENSVSFRCTKCNQLFKHAKRAAIHYSNCKHLRVKKNRFTVTLKDVEWICLQCHYHSNEMSDLIVHKRSCSMFCNSVSSTGANIERCIRNYSDTCINFCKKCCYQCLSTVSFNKHNCDERLNYMISCYIPVPKLTQDDCEQHLNKHTTDCEENLNNYDEHSNNDDEHLNSHEHPPVIKVENCANDYNDNTSYEKSVSQSGLQEANLPNSVSYQVPSISNIHEPHSSICVNANIERNYFYDVQDRNLIGQERNLSLEKEAKLFIENEDLCDSDNVTVMSDQPESLNRTNSDIEVTSDTSFLNEQQCQLCLLKPCKFCRQASSLNTTDLNTEERDEKPCLGCLNKTLIPSQVDCTNKSEKKQTAVSSCGENVISAETDRVCTLNCCTNSISENAASEIVSTTNGQNISGSTSVPSSENCFQELSNIRHSQDEIFESTSNNRENSTLVNCENSTLDNRENSMLINSDNFTLDNRENFTMVNTENSRLDNNRNSILNNNENSTLDNRENSAQFYTVKLVRRVFEDIKHISALNNLFLHQYLVCMEISGGATSIIEETESSPDPRATDLTDIPENCHIYISFESVKRLLVAKSTTVSEETNSSEKPKPEDFDPNGPCSLEYNKPQTYFFNSNFEKFIYDLTRCKLCEMYISFPFDLYEIQVMWCYDLKIYPHIYIVRLGRGREETQFACARCCDTLTISNMIDHVVQIHEGRLINIVISSILS